MITTAATIPCRGSTPTGLMTEESTFTRERIRQIESKALRKLRHPSRSTRLRPFMDSTN